MDERAFWQVIAELNDGLPPRKPSDEPAAGRSVFRRRGRREPRATAELAGRLEAWTAQASDDDLLGFGTSFAAMQARSYRWELWAAAWLALGGASDDTFLDFRSWLVLHGRETFERVLADPDALADLVWREDEEDFGDAEVAASVAAEEWRRRHGGDAPFDGIAPLADEPAGEEFHEDDPAWFRARLPRLSERFLDAD